MAKLDDFDPFANATPAVSEKAEGAQGATKESAATDEAPEGVNGRQEQTEGRAGGKTAKRPAAPKGVPQGGGSARTTTPAAPREPQPQLDPDEERHLIAALGADAGRAAASVARADEHVAAYERTIQRARVAGVSERKIWGAVARFDIHIPDPK